MGKLADVVINPVKKRVTHLVVDSSDRDESVRLVPVELAASGYGSTEISLSCRMSELTQFESVREFAYLPLGQPPETDPDWDVGAEDVFAVPTSGTDQFGDYAGELTSGVGLEYDRVPKGEVELRRSSRVESADGNSVGHIEGLVVDHGEITSVTLERGHLWWRRDIGIPVESVSKVETDTVTVSLSSDEIAHLPAIHAGRGRK